MRHILPGSVSAPCHEHGQSVTPSPPDLQAPLRGQAEHHGFPVGHSSAGKELRLGCPVPPGWLSRAAPETAGEELGGQGWEVGGDLPPTPGSPEDPLGSASGPAMKPEGH